MLPKLAELRCCGTIARGHVSRQAGKSLAQRHVWHHRKIVLPTWYQDRFDTAVPNTCGRSRGEARVREESVRVYRGTQGTNSVQRLADTYDTVDSLTCDRGFCWVLAGCVHRGDKRAPASLQSLMGTLVNAVAT
jgi:hypothetical protein